MEAIACFQNIRKMNNSNAPILLGMVNPNSDPYHNRKSNATLTLTTAYCPCAWTTYNVCKLSLPYDDTGNKGLYYWERQTTAGRG